ncbi:bifunctional N(6)-L-threonylcarbamoyladenine synthase/serine/threonine protein kinase [Candidatus Woesearchaeota archaeon]|nr:MAG: bifunctional N(6)-L-threonylcarbamoyladenine synthase/serine/threonine protein kinase [Candidatus Woesearchaeota archaeon]
MITLGIESTAHTLGVAVVKDKHILSNEKSSYTTASGGMIPVKLVEHHLEQFSNVLDRALAKANIAIDDVDVIAFSQAPGIGHALRIGATLAKSISLVYKKPLMGVNHCIAHLEIGRHFAKAKDPVLLYASGANTQIIAYDAGKYRVFGETLDIGIGNFLDSFGRYLELGFPAGPKIEELAKKSKKYIELPYAVKGMDVSFTGILTNLSQKIAHHKKEDLCFSAQETVFAMLIEVTERAMAHCNKNELVLGGGVACNKRLQEMASLMCKERNAVCFTPENQFLVDNAAMIALTGEIMHRAGNKTTLKDAGIKPYERTDDVKVNWR